MFLQVWILSFRFSLSNNAIIAGIKVSQTLTLSMWFAPEWKGSKILTLAQLPVAGWISRHFPVCWCPRQTISTSPPRPVQAEAWANLLAFRHQIHHDHHLWSSEWCLPWSYIKERLNHILKPKTDVIGVSRHLKPEISLFYENHEIKKGVSCPLGKKINLMHPYSENLKRRGGFFFVHWRTCQT